MEAWIRVVAPSVGEYQGIAVSRRLTQRIIQLSLNPYIAECARRIERGGSESAIDETVFWCGGLIIDPRTGCVRLTLWRLIESFFESFFHWIHVLLSFGSSMFVLAMARRGRATLLFGVGAESLVAQGDDARFIEFCRAGRVTPLAKASRIIVQAVGRVNQTDGAFAEYARFPLFSLLRENRPRIREVIRFLAAHGRSFFRYVVAVLRFPLVSIVGRDFAYHALVEWVNRQGLIENVVITNSNYSAQPLWMSDLENRKFETHMVWYSQNSIPLTYAADGIESDVPNFRYIRVDQSWVWTEAFGKYLQKLGIQGTFHAVGPIMWYLHKPKTEQRVNDQVRIAVFDVTPFSPEAASHLGFVHNYYKIENLARFVEDILEVRAALEARISKSVCVLLKHKRSYHPLHDRRYIDLIDNVDRSKRHLIVVPPETDIFELIAGSDLAVVIPYSSPAYIADELGVPAIYYDPAGELLPTHIVAPNVEFVTGRENLLQKVIGVVSGKGGFKPKTGA